MKEKGKKFSRFFIFSIYYKVFLEEKLHLQWFISHYFPIYVNQMSIQTWSVFCGSVILSSMSPFCEAWLVEVSLGVGGSSGLLDRSMWNTGLSRPGKQMIARYQCALQHKKHGCVIKIEIQQYSNAHCTIKEKCVFNAENRIRDAGT